MTTHEDRVSWVHNDLTLVERLNELWPTWADETDDGLIAQLDNLTEWSGWDDWDEQAKITGLTAALDAWYPPEQPETAGDQVDRLAWVMADAELVERLNTVWPGWSDASTGLAATLDGTAEWNGWEAWDIETRLSYLRATLDAWYPPDEATSPAEFQAGLTEALTQVLTTVPGAAALSQEDLSRVVAEVLAEQHAALSH